MTVDLLELRRKAIEAAFCPCCSGRTYKRCCGG